VPAHFIGLDWSGISAHSTWKTYQRNLWICYRDAKRSNQWNIWRNWCFAGCVSPLPLFSILSLKDRRYMIGGKSYISLHGWKQRPLISAQDNPQSGMRWQALESHLLMTIFPLDIAGANGANWNSILVETGVYDPSHGCPSHRPTHYADNVEEAVKWALERHLEKELREGRLRSAWFTNFYHCALGNTTIFSFIPSCIRNK